MVIGICQTSQKQFNSIRIDEIGYIQSHYLKNLMMLLGCILPKTEFLSYLKLFFALQNR